MKKKLFLIFLLLVLLIYLISEHLMFFAYFNPYTNTKPLKYIATSIKELDKGFSYAKKSVRSKGYNIKYLYFNAYGSGFIENNNIPNDLDYAVGIDLGKYNYDGKNAKKIAEDAVDKINSFRSALNFYYNTNENTHTLIDTTFLAEQSNINKNRSILINNISQTIDKALNDTDYVYYTKKKIITESNESKEIEVPYIMKSREILLENMTPIKLHSDLVSYNNKMPHYMREISIVLEYYITLNKDGTEYEIELVPESFLGERLQMKRRLFTSCVFVHYNSIPFITKMGYVKDDDKYLYFRILSFKRHLQEINNIISLRERIFKIPKRLRQSADVINPVLADKEYQSIKDYTGNILSDSNVVLLNEYSNLLNNIYDLSLNPEEFKTLINNGKIDTMLKEMNNIIKNLQSNGVEKKNVAILENFTKNLILNVSKIEDKSDIYALQKFLDNNIQEIKNNIILLIPKETINVKEIVKIIDKFNKIYVKSGYHKITLYWLDKNTIGVLENDYTKNIKDLNKLAKENNLVDRISYKLIKEENAPYTALRYDVFVRNNCTKEEDRYLEEINNKLLKDKKNFKLKYRVVFVK